MSAIDNNNKDLTPSSSLTINITQMDPSTPARGGGSNNLSDPSILPKPSGWWKSLTAVYQIYPASFLSSTSSTNTTTGTVPSNSSVPPSFPSHLPQPPTSGLGDIPSITSKLPYLQSLGIDAVWLSPPYPSPLVDMGYDISSYTSINPLFGTLSDMTKLITTAHNLNIRVLMDLVINHTSTSHQWFIESSKSRDNPYSDYYIWKDPLPASSSSPSSPPESRPPNNWPSMFGGSAWTYVPSREQFYLHLFAESQADLNFEPSHIRQAIYQDAIHFWLKLGIDGFRVDTCGIYSKDQSFRDGVVDPKTRWREYGDPLPYILSGPRIHEFWREIKSVTEEYGDVMFVGELGPLGKSEILKYTGEKRKEMSMVFSFELPSVGGFENLGGFEDVGDGRSWKLGELKGAIGRCQEVMNEETEKEDEKKDRTGNGWPTVVAENHDQPRSLSRFGSPNPKYRERSAKLLAIMLASLSGTLFIYQGQEIGMTNIPLTWTWDDIRDIASIEYYERKKRENPGDEDLLKRIWRGVVAMSRDNARTPMQWSDEENAGFGYTKKEEEPWMKVNDNYEEINVENQKGVNGSVWEFWREVLEVRKYHRAVLMWGEYHEAGDKEDERVFTFEKKSSDGKGRAVVVLNFSEEKVQMKLPELKNGKWELLLSNVEKGDGKMLEAWEGRIYMGN